jgi:hypothetical protein
MNNRKQRKSCRTKKKYTEENIKVRVKYLNKIGVPVKPYLCPMCKGWHITSQNKVKHVHKLIDEAMGNDDRKTSSVSK